MAVFEGLSERLQGITEDIGQKSRVTENDIKQMMREIRLALLEADVNYTVVKDLIDKIADQAYGEAVMTSLTPGQQIIKIVRDELVEVLGGAEAKLSFAKNDFTVLMLFGLQGAGKTTTAAKLARLLKKDGKKPLLASVDTHRPAAQEQLAILAESIDVPCFIQPEEKSAAKIAERAVERARYLMANVLIVDTAGRTTLNDELMDELKDITSAVTPHEKLLVVDGMIGQEAVNVAQTFEQEIGLDGFIMTKMDGDARGGAALSIYAMTKKPIKFIATGEKVDALEVFHPDRMASRILGMGDVLSLIDKVSATVDEERAEQMLKNIEQNRFTMDDMLNQFEQIQNMGPLKDILGMLPQMKGVNLADANVDDGMVNQNMAIIRSMTKAERKDVKLLDASRRKRIAAGSGTSVQNVNQLVRQYHEMVKMMNQMGFGGKKGKRGKNRRRRNPFGNLPFNLG